MRKLLAVLLLWIPFSLACIVAVPVLLWHIINGNEKDAKPLGKAMDRVLAYLMGFSGDYTLSAELATSDRLQWLRKFLDWIVPDHCFDSAVNEGKIKKGT